MTLIVRFSLFTVALLAGLNTLHAQRSFDPNLVVFAGEIRNYVEQATRLNQLPDSNTPDREKAIQELQKTGVRAAKIYFKQNSSDTRSQLNQHLQTVLKSNSKLRHHFVFLGNGFAEEAQNLLHLYQARQKKIRTYSTIGGAALGILGGGGFLVFKSKTALTISAQIGGKDLLIAAGIVAAGTGIGFGAGTLYAGKLPMDTSVHNAKDFAARYPHGIDFINDIDRSQDLKLLLSLRDS